MNGERGSGQVLVAEGGVGVVVVREVVDRGALEGQPQLGQLLLDLGDGLGAEVADVEQVRLAARDELADGVDALALEGVGGTGLQVQLVDHEGEVLLEGLVHGRGADLDALGLDIELAGQAEELDEGLARRRQGVARGDGGLRLDVDDEAVEVGALLDAGGLDGVGDLLDRRVDGVHGDAGDLRVRILVLVGRHVAAPALD